MNVFKQSIWEIIESYEKESIERIGIIDAVETILQNLWTSVALSESIFDKYTPQLSSELFITTYYIRNISYFVGSYQLAKQGLVIPSHNLQRTILETLIKGYMFIVEEDISDMNFIATHRDGANDPTTIGILNNIITKGNLSDLFIDSAKKIVRRELINDEDQKKLVNQVSEFSLFNKNIRIIYSRSREKQWRNFYQMINVTAHPSVRGVVGDILYNKKNVENSLEMILLLAYGNIMIYLERFHPKFNNPEISKIFKDSLNLIVEKLGEVIVIEPNKAKYQGFIKFEGDKYQELL